MITMDNSLIRLYREGIISRDKDVYKRQAWSLKRA